MERTIEKHVQLSLIHAEKRVASCSSVQLRENQSLMPNILGKSFLFAPLGYNRNKTNDEEFEQVPSSYANTEIFYSGWQLDQNDLTGLLYLLRLGHGQDNFEVTIPANDFLRGIGKAPVTENLLWLMGENDKFKKHKGCTYIKYRFGTCFCSRLKKTTVMIRHFYKASGQNEKLCDVDFFCIADSLKFINNGNLISFSFNKSVLKMLRADHYTYYNLALREKIRRKQLALSLHSYLMSNEPVTKITHDFALSFWGSRRADKNGFLKDFRSRAIRPLIDTKLVQSFREEKGVFIFER